MSFLDLKIEVISKIQQWIPQIESWTSQHPVISNTLKALAAIATYLAGGKVKEANLKKKQIENDKSELENVTKKLAHIEQAREIETQILKDMRKNIDELIKYNDYLEGVIKDLRKRITKYEDKHGQIDD